jgi:carboxypeptidase PM20D1
VPDRSRRLHAELERRFPLLHERLERTAIPPHALLLRWVGRSDTHPVVLMAHPDVVPADDGDPWQYPPFAAELVDGRIWGRGTLDDSGALVAVCTAVETLLEESHIPAQDV